ncbi:aryl-sulfate sulfotransferase [Halorarius halobius]|uniref:aryl-sulfate sulfotransferase n=1 Tax=Halorarius halobius TaxID=2962671 RepID=UPI0020CBA170|nr:aryl-sulfate sulfotransferase [Halorarius halobius]
MTDIRSEMSKPLEDRDAVVEPSNGTTVVTTHATGNGVGELFAVGPSGRPVYYNDTHETYFDVDPVPNTTATLQYIAVHDVPDEECRGSVPCRRNIVERVNITTGETSVVYVEPLTMVPGSKRWHDVDTLPNGDLLVADIATDSVKRLDPDTGIINWAWNADSAYPPASGGSYAGDWTHLNDVEALPDGRYMASVRNHDQVVFLDESGLQPNWTLGTDGNHNVLYEQHNPDYIPEANGGPAVIVADSENNRAVEYQRVDGAWEQSWSWSDSQLNWPRDADRLPNGNTLITDSNGHRVIEVGRDGDIVWSMSMSSLPYEAERLETGDESYGGESAESLQLDSRTATVVEQSGGGSAGIGARIWVTIRSVVPGTITNGLLFILPAWVSTGDAVTLLILGGVCLTWLSVELYWIPYTVSVHRPLELRSK